MRKIALFLVIIITLTFFGCSQKEKKVEFIDLIFDYSMPLIFAENFRVDYYNGGYVLLTVSGKDKFLIVPEGEKTPKNIGSDIKIINRPQKIYLAATSAMCLFDVLGGLETISFSGTKSDGWYIENAKYAMENGSIIYAGKYSAPDYEMLLSKKCDLAIESTMIYHTPEVKEKLESIGIPVIVDMSSYEKHPLGRTEWIKFYGALLGAEEIAEKLFNEQLGFFNSINVGQNTGKTVAFFYINSSGIPVVRKSGDYVSKMIEMSGGEYVFNDVGDPNTGTGTVGLEMEAFYSKGKEADIIIYNSTIGGEVATLNELLKKSSLLKDFKAIKEGNVWCTNQNFYQDTTGFGIMMREMYQILSAENAENFENDTTLYYMRKLN